jgi:hypothetical protein
MVWDGIKSRFDLTTVNTAKVSNYREYKAMGVELISWDAVLIPKRRP